MKLSYFCQHCGKHLRSADHTDCRKALRAQRRLSEATRLAEGERNRKRYAAGTLGEVLAKTDDCE